VEGVEKPAARSIRTPAATLSKRSNERIQEQGAGFARIQKKHIDK
jgi:hypothetical protein